MAYTHHSPISPYPAQQYRPSPIPSPQPSPRPSPQPSPQPYVYQHQVGGPQYNQPFAFPPRSPQQPIQQGYHPPQSIFPLPQGYTPPTQIPPSLQARVKTPAPPEQTTASPRPHYAYLPQQNVITSTSIHSPPRATSPARPLPPPQRTRPESGPPATRIQIPTSSFTENTLYKQPSPVSASPTRTPVMSPPSPGPLVSPQPQFQALAHRPSYSASSASPPKPVSNFGPPILTQRPGQIPTHLFGQIPSQVPGQTPSQRSESPNRGRPLPTPTPRTPSPTKSIQPPTVSRFVADNSPQLQQQQQQAQHPPLPVTSSVTSANPNGQQNPTSSSIHRPTSSMSTISASSHASYIKEIALPPATTPGQPFVPYWKRNLHGGPREHGVQRRGTVAGGQATVSAVAEIPQPTTSSFSSSNPPMSSFPNKAPSRSETKPGAGITRKPTSSFDFGTRNTPGTQPEPQPRTNDTTQSETSPFPPGTITQQPPARSIPSQTSSTFSLHQRRGAEITRSNTEPGPEPRLGTNTQPQSPAQINRSRLESNASTVPASTTVSTSGSGFSNRSVVPPPPKPARSQTYDPKPFMHKEPSDPTTNRHQGPPSPRKLSTGEKDRQPSARTPSPQYGILDMPRSSFTQRVEAKTEVLNGQRSRGSSPARSESPVKSIPPVSPFARSERPARNPSPTRSQGFPRWTPESSNSSLTNASPFPPALKRSSVTPQSVTLQLAAMGIGEDRDRGRALDQRQVQRSPSPPKPQQERVQQNDITKSASGWPSNLPRLPRTPATSQHPNSTVNTTNQAHSVTSTFSNRPDSTSHPPASTPSFDRNPVRQNTNPPNHSSSKFTPREDGRRSVADLNLDDAPPPSLRRSPSPASSIASSNFSSFSAAMENYKNGVSGSGVSPSSRDPHQRTGSVPVRQPTEPVKTGRGHSQSQSQSQPMTGARQQVRSQPPQQNHRRLPASPVAPSFSVDNTPVRHQPRSPTVPTIRTPQARSPQRQKISFPANPDSDSDGDANGPRIAVSVTDDGHPGPRISVSGSDDVPSISVNIGGADDDYGGGPATSLNPRGPSVTADGGRRSVAELPTIRRGGGLSCGGCGGMIVGRVVSAMGARWHPGCFKCCVCDELLENLSSYEKDGRSFCHLDYHEIYAPRCYHCHTAIADERFITLDDSELGSRTYHEQHFFCAECGDPFLPPSSSATGNRSFAGDGVFEDADVGFTVYKGHPYCENCHVRLRMPKCKRCKKSIRDGVRAVEALGGKWCWGCFVCTRCEKPFNDPTFFQRDQQPFCERCFSIMIRNEV